MKVYSTSPNYFHTKAFTTFADTLAARDFKDAPTITVIGGGETVSEPTYMSDRKGHNGITQDGAATTLTAQEKERPVIGTSVVRRLTPLECTRLQGFPDGWVDIGTPEEVVNKDGSTETVYYYTDENGKKKKVSDSAKYKALGNSIAMPFWEWLARRIAAQYERPVTMGSLFDGIGGFPLAFSKCGGKAVWSSEIESFPIAVVKQHFGDEDAGIVGDWKDYI